MIRPLRTTVAATVTGLVTASLAAVAAPPAAAEPRTLTGASLRWAVNHEVNSGAFAPGTWNLMSAGLVGNPGAGGQTLRTADGGATWSNGAAAGWSAQTGNVTLTDLQADGSRAPATFQGTRTDAAGVPTNATAASVNAGTELVFGAGTGTLDPVADDATVTWDGDATVLLYSGMSYFHLSDPVLEVDAGRATLSAVLGGFASDMNDMTKWTRVADARVTVATASGVDVTDSGLSGTADYLGVAYDAPSGATPQTRSGAAWGSFPRSFVDFQQQLGSGSYWYSSGGAADPKKPAAPFAVSYASTAGVTQVASATRLKVPGKVKRGKKGKVTLTVRARQGVSASSGTVRVTLKRTSGKPRVVKSATRTLRGGRARLGLPRLTRGRYKITAAFSGSDLLASSRTVSRFRVR